MESLKSTKKKEQEGIFLLIKALALFFCTYPLFEMFFQYSSMDSLNEISLQSLLTSLALILLVLCVWLLLNTRKLRSRWYVWLEIGIFYLICLLSIGTSGGYASSYKFLFVYMVVAYTIQINQATGFLISAISSVTLLFMDLFFFREGGVNIYMQSDIALSMLFFTVAYLLGRYARMEKNHIEELVRLANVDGLTGLYNHRYFFESIERLYSRCKSEGGSFSLIMFDIDYFKHYNDIFGHQMGDVVLQKLAACAQKEIRPDDILCRYGGEEFTLLLPDTSLEAAQQIAEQIRLSVQNMPVEGEHLLSGGHLTISLGVSQMQASDESYNNVVSRADSALYRAKYLRKNRVETYLDVVEQFSNPNDETREALVSARTLISLVNVRDSYTYSHTERVVFSCEQMAEALHMGEEDRRTLVLSAFLHDLGKVNVPKEILIADHSLSEEEWEMIRRHPEASYNIVRRIPGLEAVAQIVRQHHERWDGKGYPDGLAGEAIHPLARVLALADAFDAMTSARPYKKAKSYPQVFKEIQACKGTQFDPNLAEIFIETMKSLCEESEYQVPDAHKGE